MFSLSLSLSLSLSQTSMDQFFISLTLKSTFRKNKRVGMSYKPSRSFSHIHLLCLSFSFLHSHCISLFSCVLCLSNTLYPYPLYFSFYHTILSLTHIVCLFYRMFSLYKAPSIPIPYVCLFLLVHLHTFCYVKHTLAKFLRHIGTGRFWYYILSVHTYLSNLFHNISMVLSHTQRAEEWKWKWINYLCRLKVLDAIVNLLVQKYQYINWQSFETSPISERCR